MNTAMTRTGKIARLSLDVRNELNRRIENGEQGTRLVAWLNGDVRVKRVLAEQFDARAINDQNLSDWKAGGYQDWREQERERERIRSLTENLGELANSGWTRNASMIDNLAAVLTIRYAEVMMDWKGEVTEELDSKLNALHRLRMDIVALRRSHVAAMEWELRVANCMEDINDRIRRSRDDEEALEPTKGLINEVSGMMGQGHRTREREKFEWQLPKAEDIKLKPDPDENTGASDGLDEKAENAGVPAKAEEEKKVTKQKSRRLKAEKPEAKEDSNANGEEATPDGREEGEPGNSNVEATGCNPRNRSTCEAKYPKPDEGDEDKTEPGGEGANSQPAEERADTERGRE